MVLQAELNLRVITLWFLVLSQFFRDGMGPFKFYIPDYVTFGLFTEVTHNTILIV